MSLFLFQFIEDSAAKHLRCIRYLTKPFTTAIDHAHYRRMGRAAACANEDYDMNSEIIYE